MTYVEFFDRSAAKNICTCLTYAPHRVIYLGDSVKQMERHTEYYRQVFAGRGYGTEFLCRSIPSNDLERAIRVLSEIVESYPDCVFDITGGDELLTLALGVVYATHPQNNIQIHRFNIRNGKICDCDKDGVTVFRDIPALSVEENVRIHGGRVAYGDIDSIFTYRWDFENGFLEDYKVLWELCRQYKRDWNSCCSYLGTIVEEADLKRGGITCEISRYKYNYKCRGYEKNKEKILEIKDVLLEKGFIKDYCEGENSVSVTFSDLQVKKCLTKAGQLLELKVYLTAMGLRDEKREPVYNDALTGALIDWDGKVHDDLDDFHDTVNEVDVMLMHGIVPVFISCKNGNVTSDELYKLKAVADRFGGRFSKKALVAPALSTIDKTTAEFIRQRAKDMGIALIEDMWDAEDEDIEDDLSLLWTDTCAL